MVERDLFIILITQSGRFLGPLEKVQAGLSLNPLRLNSQYLL